MNACRSCGAAIRWERTPTGKAIPLDAEPTPTGNVTLIGGAAVTLTKVDLAAARAERATLYMPHHATCPHGKAWKR